MVEKKLPPGFNIIIENGTCGIEANPSAVTNATYYFEASNQTGTTVTLNDRRWARKLDINVLKSEDQTVSDINATPTIQYIEGSHGAFQPNQGFVVQAGKYYGDNVGKYLSLQIFGPYPSKSNADPSRINFANDYYSRYDISLSSYNIPITQWFTGFYVSIADEGYFRIFAAFCTSSSLLTDSTKCKASTTDPILSKVISIGRAITGQGSAGASYVTPEDIKIIVE